MNATYTKHAAICSKFYELTVDSEQVAKFVYDAVEAKPGERALFVGGMFGVAAALMARGLETVVADYSPEMVAVGRAQLSGARVVQGDLESLDVGGDFDLVLVVGRVFTHMLTESQVASALQGCHAALRSGGRIFADNYESSRIEETSYFNGTVVGKAGDTEIERRSLTKRVSELPHVIRWSATYSGVFDGAPFEFNDSIDHRAFARREFAEKLEHAGFTLLKQADNFDETSFYSVGRLPS